MSALVRSSEDKTGPTEATTRRELIDSALKKAGGDVSNHDLVGIGIPVDGFESAT